MSSEDDNRTDNADGTAKQSDASGFSGECFGLEVVTRSWRTLSRVISERIAIIRIGCRFSGRSGSRRPFARSVVDAMAIQRSPLQRSNLRTPHAATTASMTMLAARLAYTFDLRGPCISLDTA